MSYEELKKLFQEKTVRKDWFLLDSADAVEMIRIGLKNGLHLDVVEGFLRSPEGAFEPRQEYSSNQFFGLKEEEYEKKIIDFIDSLTHIPDLFFEVWMS